MAKRLVQILAVEKSIKTKRENELTAVLHNLKPELMNGFQKNYQPNKEGGQTFPSEAKKVVLRAEDAIKQVKTGLVELFDVVATKDATNSVAKSDVVVDGVTILKDVPAVHLLFIEKKLTDISTFIKKIPTLGQEEDWKQSSATGLWETSPSKTHKTAKLESFDVIVPATKEHPAQVGKNVKDEIIGEWSTVKFSGAITVDKQTELLDRVEKLQKAVKFARAEANSVPVVELETGAAVLSYIFQ